MELLGRPETCEVFESPLLGLSFCEAFKMALLVRLKILQDVDTGVWPRCLCLAEVGPLWNLGVSKIEKPH